MLACRAPQDFSESSHQLTRQSLETRLNSLKDEYEKGQTQLSQLQSQLRSLRETKLRISGAIMVLEEILSSSTQSHGDVAIMEERRVEGGELSSTVQATGNS